MTEQQRNVAGFLIQFCFYRNRPVLIVHGDKREAKARLVQQAQPFPHIKFCQVLTYSHINTAFVCPTR